MWNNKIEKVCINLSDKCIHFKNLHDEATTFYYNLDNYLSIFSIIVLTATGTTTFATLSFNDIYINIIIGIIVYITAVVDSIKKFINPSEKNILHNNAMKQYSNLYHNIQKQLIMELEQRQSSKDYLGWITREFENLQANSPDLPGFLQKKKEPEDILLENVISTYIDSTHSVYSEHSNHSKPPDMEDIKDKYTLNRFMDINLE